MVINYLQVMGWSSKWWVGFLLEPNQPDRCQVLVCRNRLHSASIGAWLRPSAGRKVRKVCLFNIRWFLQPKRTPSVPTIPIFRGYNMVHSFRDGIKFLLGFVDFADFLRIRSHGKSSPFGRILCSFFSNHLKSKSKMKVCEWKVETTLEFEVPWT